MVVTVGLEPTSVRSIVVQTPWSGVCTRFALTNSRRFLLRRTAHRADASLVCPIDVNEVLSHHGRNYKPLSKPGSLSNPLFSMAAATLAHLHNSRNWLVYPSVYPVHNSRTQAYTKPAVHKNGHQILLWCRHSISNEIQVMYNALYLIHFTVAEAKLKFC